MKTFIYTSVFFIAGAALVSCEMKKESKESRPVPIIGTWKLIQGIVISKKDTVVTDYTKNASFIKVINDTHFTFLHHDLEKGKGAAPVFSAGGGSYSLRDSLYTEHLEYCTDRQWEGNDFLFSVRVSNDTLTQRGLEKVEGAGIDQINIERYVRVKQNP